MEINCAIFYTNLNAWFCPKSISILFGLNEYEVAVHEREKHFTCKICDASFARKGHLKGHIASAHEGKKPFKCTVCDARLSCKEHLIRHIASVLEGKKPFKCNMCVMQVLHKSRG